MPELLDELSLSKQDGTYRKVINTYCKTELLIIDEWLIRKLSTQERYDLLEIIEKRATDVDPEIQEEYKNIPETLNEPLQKI